jgi:uridine kinase
MCRSGGGGYVKAMRPGPDEPNAGPWRVERLDTFARAISAASGRRGPGPRVVAIDGRGGAGKTSLTMRLHRAMPGSAVVHTDDVAWWHSRFGWDDLMSDGILLPLRAGQDVDYQPPAWKQRGRHGRLTVPATSTTLLVEGVGAARRELTHLVDVAVWVQSDFDLAKRRGLLRDTHRDGTDVVTAQREWDAWADEEIPFLSMDRPWQRADFIVAGTPVIDHDPKSHLVIAPPLPSN